jgi:adenylate kinase
MITPYFSREEFNNKPLILSSVGRWQGEEQVIQEATEKSSHPQKAVIFLSMPEDTLRERLEIARENQDRGKREDDQETYLVTRLNEFNSKTKPVLDYYKNNGQLIEIDGTKSPDEVTQEIIAKLLKFAA